MTETLGADGHIHQKWSPQVYSLSSDFVSLAFKLVVKYASFSYRFICEVWKDVHGIFANLKKMQIADQSIMHDLISVTQGEYVSVKTHVCVYIQGIEDRFNACRNEIAKERVCRTFS